MRYYYDSESNIQLYPNKGKIHFETEVQGAIWENVVLGQLSDGLWEDGPDWCKDWEFWWNLEPVIDGNIGWECDVDPSDGKTSYPLMDILKIEGGRSIEECAKMCKAGITNPFECDVIHYYQHRFDYSHFEDAIKSLEERYGSIEEAFEEYASETYSKEEMLHDIKIISDSMKTKRG